MKLELQGITKAFGPVVANRDINLVVERGEIHALRLHQREQVLGLRFRLAHRAPLLVRHLAEDSVREELQRLDAEVAQDLKHEHLDQHFVLDNEHRRPFAVYPVQPLIPL